MESLPQEWLSCWKRALARSRAVRLRKGVFWTATTVFPLTLLLALFLILEKITPALGIVLGTTALAVPILAGLAAACFPPKTEVVLREIDRRFNIADGAEAAAEFAGKAPEFWRQSAMTQTLAALQQADWSQRWPIVWPRHSRIVCSLHGLTALFAIILAVVQPGSPGFASAAEETRRAKLETLADSLSNWRESVDDPPATEEWVAFEDELARARENLQNPDFDDREVLLELSRVEDRLRAILEQTMPQSREPLMLALADGFAGIPEFESLTEALRDGHLEDAAEQFEELAEDVADDSVKLDPNDGETRDMLDRLAETAGEMRETEQASSAEWAERIESFCESVKEGDQEAAGECLAGMGDALEDGSDQAEMSEDLLAQLDAAREKFLAPGGEAEEEGRLAEINSGGGDEAGDGSVDDFLGEEESIEQKHQPENLSGTPLEDGESQRRTVATDEGRPEQTAREHVAADLLNVEQLSREAIENEAIPLSHRQTIQRYFHSIRPRSEDEN